MNQFRAALLACALFLPLLPAQAQDTPSAKKDSATKDTKAAADTVKDGDDYHGEIVVTAPGLGRLDMLAGTSVVSGEELQRDNAGQIGDVLAKLPGVSASSFSPGASRPVLRGFSGDRVRVLVDGIGSIDASNTSADHAVTIDPLTAEKVEVLRGPAVLLYGSSAIGGAVNVLDKRIPRTLGHEPVHFDGFAGIDTASNLRTVGASIDTPLSGAFEFHVDGSYRKTDDVEIAGYQVAAPLRAELLAEADTLPAAEGDALRAAALHRGTLPNSATDTKSFGSGLTWFGSGASLGVSVGRYETDYGVPTMPGDAANVSIGLKQTRYDLRGSLDLGGGPFEQLTTRWGYSDYTHTEFEGPNPGTTFYVNGVEGRVVLAQRQRGDWSGSIGGQYFHRDLKAVGDEAFVPPNATEQWALFTLQKVGSGPFQVQAGGRYEDTNVTAPTVWRHFGTVSGALGLSFETDGGLRFGVNGSRTERAPTAEELFADGPHVATQQYEQGAPNLTTERAWGLEGYVRGELGPTNLSFAVYQDWFSHFVYLAATGIVQDSLPVYAQRQGDVRWFGVEGEASTRLYDSGAFTIVGDVKGDYTRASLVGGGPVPRIPPVSLLAGLEYQSDPFDARFELEWAGKQDRIAAYETPTKAYTTANISFAWKPLRGFDNLTVMLSGDNLFDVTRRRHASFTKDFVPLAGRNVKLSVKVSL